MKTGTLKELGVKAGDVVLWLHSGTLHEIVKCRTLKGGVFKGQVEAELTNHGVGIFKDERFRVLSRISETLKTWGEMNDTEKGELLLAHHKGETIEYTNERDNWGWSGSGSPLWAPSFAYRVKPTPKRETVVMFASDKLKGFGLLKGPKSAYKLTFETIDGKPNPTTVKLQETEQ